MDYIFWAQAGLITIIVFELVIRSAAPFIGHAGNGRLNDHLTIAFGIRFFITTYIAVKLEDISEWIAAALPEEVVMNALDYPLWLIPIFMYGLIMLGNRQGDNKRRF